MPDDDREHDLVIFGATGFTGALTAEHLARRAPDGLRWALAGRNRAKLETVRERVAAVDPRWTDLPLVHADTSTPLSVAALAASTRVVVSTVGPYLAHGEPLVAACAQAGTDYLDLTGEPEFVDLMYVRHHGAAVASGARIVHSCGFDSIPHDLGAWFTVNQLPEDVALKVEGFVSAGGRPSGGTVHSALGIVGRLREGAKAAAERKKIEPRPAGRRVRLVRGAPRHERSVGAWVAPLPTIDPQVVRRSAFALDRYGPDFSYGHYVAVKRLPVALAAAGGMAALLAAAQIGPVRDFVRGRISPGDGPSAEQRAKGWFDVRFVGEGGGQRVVTSVSGGDPGYGDTAKMLGESALCMALDDLPESAGQVTPTVALRDALKTRLEDVGIQFRVIEGT
jgi:saccharopine dehydrogenase (NAD+, L-glutamate forming)